MSTILTSKEQKHNDDAGPGDPSSSYGSWLRLYLALCVFRILNTFLIQSYFDPDEFWQTMEPAYCQVFSNSINDPQQPCQGFTWEWTRRPPTDSTLNFIERSMLGPARTYLSVVPVHGWFRLLQLLQMDTYWAVTRGPMILYAVTVAAPLDFAVWYAARWLPILSNDTKEHNNQHGNNTTLAGWGLFLSLSSWFHGYTLVRTFANGQEALALAVAIALVSPELLGNNINRQHAFLRSCVAFFIGGMGVAVRFTSVAAFVPLGVLLALLRQKATSSWLAAMGYLLVPCALFGIAGVGVAMVVDYLFFGFWTIPFLGNFHFNVVLDYADLFGSHPFNWYFTAGLPAITGLLLPFFLVGLFQFLVGRHGAHPAHQRLWIITLSYLIIMSFNAHKEFRYILPVLPLVCLLTASSARSFFVGQTNHKNGASKRRIRIFLVGLVWCTANLIAVLYLGLFHQSGAVLVNRAIVEHARASSSNAAPTSSILRIHYLTGGCHTTPLLSHLHAPPLQFDTWHLNCSPQCRANPDALCETEQFARDPVGFVGRSYFACQEGERQEEEEQSCPSDSSLVPLPDYIVTFSEYAPKMQSQLSAIGLEQVARFPHSINGARMGETILGSDFGDDAYTKLRLTNGLEVSIDEIVLFAKKN